MRKGPTLEGLRPNLRFDKGNQTRGGGGKGKTMFWPLDQPHSRVPEASQKRGPLSQVRFEGERRGGTASRSKGLGGKTVAFEPGEQLPLTGVDSGSDSSSHLIRRRSLLETLAERQWDRR